MIFELILTFVIKSNEHAVAVGCRVGALTMVLLQYFSDIVQSNQKMHDLYATKHISQMVLPDAFWAV